MDPYYNNEHLADFAKIAEGSPELGKKFFDYYGAVFADGALTAREKSLIALAVAHAVQCPYCIDAYTQDCQQKGADFEQMTEALHVAVAIRGGASLVHGMQMREQREEAGNVAWERLHDDSSPLDVGRRPSLARDHGDAARHRQPAPPARAADRSRRGSSSCSRRLPLGATASGSNSTGCAAARCGRRGWRSSRSTSASSAT